MKAILKLSAVTVLLLCISIFTHGQLLKNVGDRIKQKVEQRANRKVDNAIDKELNKADDATKTKVKIKTSKTNNDNETDNEKETINSKSGPPTFKTYAKFDFIPGDKVIAIEEFANVSPGDFPDKWNTNSTGDVQKIDGREGNWLSITKPGVFMPEFVTSLPDNFTFEFELYCNREYSFYSSAFNVIFTSLNKPSKDFVMWKQYAPGTRNGVLCWFHPQNAGMANGHTGYEIWSDGKEEMKNEGVTGQFAGKSKNAVKVSMWRQKNRLRVYMNEEKVWDVPQAFSPDQKYNSIVIMKGSNHNPDDHYLFSNLRLAVGAPDTRNRLITEGKFVTRGILFDVNSDKIKPESYGVIKEIAAVLNENPDVRVKIIGHTDADGDDNSNLSLSKKRAESVKNSLVNDFSITASRFETDGKGETQPVDKNTTAEGKANNRRVEFIKLSP